jgi:hypothetical protein
MRVKALEIMPYYVKLYESEFIKFDPLSTMNIESTSTSTGESDTKTNAESSNSGESETQSKSYNSDFPQQMVTDEATGIYASSGVTTHGTGNTSGTGTEERTGNAKETNESTNTTKGYSGSAASLLTAYRATLLNIDIAVIREFEELFMQTWDTGDAYTGAY